jgi:uncharacterized protein YcfJ
MKRTRLGASAVLAAAGAMAFAGAASARGHGNAGYDYARVVEVRPIIETMHRPVSRDECWSEPVTYRESGRYVGGHRDRAPAILGGIVGAAIGNQFGSGRGRRHCRGRRTGLLGGS